MKKKIKNLTNGDLFITPSEHKYLYCDLNSPRESIKVIETIPDYLRIYITWINLYIKKARERNLNEKQIQTMLELYRAPTSIDDYMFGIYAHDSIDGCLNEDVKITEQQNDDN